MRICLFLLFVVYSLPGQAQDRAASAPVTEIEGWVDQLDSDRYEMREAATRQLMAAGPAAIDAIAARVAQNGIEAGFRGLYVLRMLALQDHKDAMRAEAAIQQLASGASAVSGRANAVLQTLRTARATHAIKILRRLGASISFTATLEQKNLGPNIVFLKFPSSWKGEPKDLEFLDWLATYNGIHITLQGDRFDDAWLESITTVEKLVSLQLNRTRITDQALIHLEELSALQALSIRFCNLSDDSLRHLDKLPQGFDSLSVFSSTISKQAFDALAARHPDWSNTRYGRGGFLGIGGFSDPGGRGCIISSVTPNQAASQAGIRPTDLITAYNGTKVTDFVPPSRLAGRLQQQPDDGTVESLSLSELIGQNEPGDVVQVTIQRDGRQIEKQVVLGEWP